MTVHSIHHTYALYLDLEWTCWDAPPLPGMQQEIIEIGIVEMDLAKLDISQEASYFVRPRRWEISPKCTMLTGITDDDIRRATPLNDVLGVITKNFQPTNKPCCTWGDDLLVIERTCSSAGLVSPFRRPVDLSKVFQGAFVTKDQVSLSAAIQMLGLEFDGVPHGALPDARNTARLHAAILRRMRREPDPEPIPAVETNEVAPLSPFAQRLATAANSLFTLKPYAEE
jgi:inhibitor of KinA sporulation pathway (predicted exonuclease)